MGYYTALNSNWEHIPKYGKKICEITNNNRTFVVYEYIGRLYLYRNGFNLSEIITGESGFVKKYKSNYQNWIESVEKKDKEKVVKLKKMAEQVINDANEIEKIWL